jgi:hypothetical protein
MISIYFSGPIEPELPHPGSRSVPDILQESPLSDGSGRNARPPENGQKKNLWVLLLRPGAFFLLHDEKCDTRKNDNHNDSDKNDTCPVRRLCATGVPGTGGFPAYCAGSVLCRIAADIPAADLLTEVKTHHLCHFPFGPVRLNPNRTGTAESRKKEPFFVYTFIMKDRASTIKTDQQGYRDVPVQDEP